MSVHRMFCAQTLSQNSQLRLDKAQAHYLGKVLRARPGQKLELFDNSGKQYAAKITELSRHHVDVEIGVASQPNTESPLNTVLVQSIARGERMDYCVQKATELGVNAIIPIFSERSVVKLSSERALKRVDHWQKIANSAAEQCGRVCVPGIAEPITLDSLLAQGFGDQACLWLLHPVANSASVAPADLTVAADQQVVLFAGPEGGFSPEEVAALELSGARCLTLGPRVLRSETAGLVGLAACQMWWGDFDG